MQLFWKYLKGKRREIFTFLLFTIIFATIFLLYRLPAEAVLYPVMLCGFLGAGLLLLDFFQVRHKHMVLAQMQSFDNVELTAFIHKETLLEEDLREVICRLCRLHGEQCEQTDRKYADMVDYYTVWAHQIKTPIASMRLQLQNEDTETARRLSLDLFRIEQYVQMVLAFVRLDSQSTDYLFREYDLDTIVRAEVRRYASEFINRKLCLVYEPLSTTVVTDEKWLSFVIGQVLSNALKYTPSGSITITMIFGKTLRIQDTGIGIAPEDLPRVFENGFTGNNGRMDKSASGIGLYLCHQVCNRLGHRITIQSKPEEGTTVDICLAQMRTDAE